MSDYTKTFLISFITSAATAVVVYVLMSRFDPRWRLPGPPPAPTPAGAVAAAPVDETTGLPVAAPSASATPALGPGERPVDVPRLQGQPIGEVKKMLSERGLLLVLEEAIASPDVPANHVIEQRPLGGSSVRRGSEVHVVLSKGALPVEVPDVSGVDVEQARARLAAVGLTIGTVTVQASDSPRGEIIATQPLAGQQAAPRTAVNVVVAEGPKLVEVPRVVRRGVGAARRAIEGAGLVPGKIVWTYNLDFEPGVVVRQQPNGGEMAPSGSEVRLWGSEPEEE